MLSIWIRKVNTHQYTYLNCSYRWKLYKTRQVVCNTGDVSVYSLFTTYVCFVKKFQTLVYSHVFSLSPGWLWSSIKLDNCMQYQFGLALLWWHQPVDRCWDVVDRWLHWTSCATPPSDYLFCFHFTQRHSTLQEKTAHHPTRCSQSSSEDYPTEGVCWASVASVQHSGWRSPTPVRMPEPSVGRWRIKVHCCCMVYSACSPWFWTAFHIACEKW